MLKRSEFAQLHVKRVGLVTNQTGRSRDGRSAVDILYEAPNLKLVAIFSPEHGIRGTEDSDTIENSADQRTQVPIYSLYGRVRRPTSKMLEGLDLSMTSKMSVPATTRTSRRWHIAWRRRHGAG
jgi:uncharacterized protein YbbC (DUF1343 family)